MIVPKAASLHSRGLIVQFKSPAFMMANFLNKVGSNQYHKEYGQLNINDPSRKKASFSGKVRLLLYETELINESDP